MTQPRLALRPLFRSRPLRAAAAGLGLAAALATAAPAQAFDPASMTDSQRAAFNEAVRSFLIENPLVLVEMVTALEAREEADAAAADRARLNAEADALYRDPASWVGGNPEGDVTIVEFMDYRCGFCRRAHPEVKDLVGRDGNIRLIVKEFPILGPESEASSRFAIAVLQTEGPEAYAKAREVLITLQGPTTADVFEGLARDLGLDPARVLARMDSPEVGGVIDANRALATRLQINGTPSFVIGETMVRGFVPQSGMAQIVAEARSRN